MKDHRHLSEPQLQAVIADIDRRARPALEDVKGLTAGALVEVYGPESCGKTTVLFKRIAEVQQHGLLAAYVDCQHTIDDGYARKLGVNTQSLLIFQPSSAEQSLDIVRMLVPTGAVRLIAVDDVNRLRVSAQVLPAAAGVADGDELIARLFARAGRDLAAELDCRESTLLYTHTTVDSPEGPVSVRPAGAALSHYAALRLDARALLQNGHSSH